ncbi:MULTISPECIES: hypothetical protein [Streptosporangium]|uniref:Uncharacterized protein n=1 Tax=Streptosporangium brasiliense TaxID=47480 RepID=A0ABT9RG67_9ACTN|nr:hypothetical protein [Streptosporangium brasiliense]MDP9868273.1 hypothetical protein [Streptosporangium brasiliense]
MPPGRYVSPAAGLFTTAVAVPEPMVATVGDIAGLRSRRPRSAGGEVPGADVDDVDALPHAKWSAVAA